MSELYKCDLPRKNAKVTTLFDGGAKTKPHKARTIKLNDLSGLANDSSKASLIFERQTRSTGLDRKYSHDASNGELPPISIQGRQLEMFVMRGLAVGKT